MNGQKAFEFIKKTTAEANGKVVSFKPNYFISLAVPRQYFCMVLSVACFGVSFCVLFPSSDCLDDFSQV